MSGAPFRSSLRNVAGDSKEGSNQSCWGTLVTVAELWLLALWEVLGLERSRWDAEHPLSKCQEHLWKLYDLCGQNTLPKHGSTSVERCSGSCGSCSQCIRATHCLVVYLKCQPCEILQGHPSLSLPSWPFFALFEKLRDRGWERGFTDYFKLFCCSKIQHRVMQLFPVLLHSCLHPGVYMYEQWSHKHNFCYLQEVGERFIWRGLKKAQHLVLKILLSTSTGLF